MFPQPSHGRTVLSGPPLFFFVEEKSASDISTPYTLVLLELVTCALENDTPTFDHISSAGDL
jgi:hypothetical protein